MKKIQRKAKQDSDKSSSEKDDKRDKCIKQEPLSSEHSKYFKKLMFWIHSLWIKISKLGVWLKK